MRFLGTAAADVLPNPFCDCPVCRDARSNPGHARLRAMFLLDDENLIDCGPDLSAACMKHGVSLTGLRRVFVTHTHEDHFCPSNAGLIHMSVTNRDMPVDIYLSEAGHDMMLQLYGRMGPEYRYMDVAVAMETGFIKLHPVKTGEVFTCGDYQVMAVKTTHRVSAAETAVNYLFEKDGRKLLYACDTGIYPRETMDALRGSRVDTLVMECTWGSITDRSSESHLDCISFVNMLNMLRDADIIREDTRIYATHINHKHDLTHKTLQEWFDANSPFPVTVACDGMEI